MRFCMEEDAYKAAKIGTGIVVRKNYHKSFKDATTFLFL